MLCDYIDNLHIFREKIDAINDELPKIAELIISAKFVCSNCEFAAFERCARIETLAYDFADICDVCETLRMARTVANVVDNAM